MRPLVIDASAGLKLVRHEDASAEVARRVGASSVSQVTVHSLLWLEVVNVLVRRHGYSGAGVLEGIHTLETVGIETVEMDRPSLLSAIDLVERHGLTAYDAAYLALAHSLDADLLTADRRLAAAAGAQAVLVGTEAGISERQRAYEPRQPTWSAWPGAGAYLAQLRGSLSD